MNQSKAKPQIRIGTMHQQPGLLFIELGDHQTFLTPRQAMKVVQALQSFIQIAGKEIGKDGAVPRSSDHGF